MSLGGRAIRAKCGPDEELVAVEEFGGHSLRAYRFDRLPFKHWAFWDRLGVPSRIRSEDVAFVKVRGSRSLR